MFTVRFLTYKGLYRTVRTDRLNVPTPEGRRGIWPNHMPILLPIDIGVVKTRENGQERKYAVSEGMLYFEDNEATMLVDYVEDVQEIDLVKARQAEARAREKLQNARSDLEIRLATIALQKALNRVNAADE